MNYEEMTEEQLEARAYELQAQKEAIREDLKLVQAARSKKVLQRQALAKLSKEEQSIVIDLGTINLRSVAKPL